MERCEAPWRTWIATGLMLALVLAGCGRTRLHRIDVQQGNVVTQEMVSKLKADMTRAQVKYVLGAPILVDAFHPDRWDYYYSFSKAGGEPEQRVLTLVFSDDRLKRIVGDVTPSTAPVPAAPRGAEPASPPASTPDAPRQ
jgi:outer membrane protein assembly factor BamE